MSASSKLINIGSRLAELEQAIRDVQMCRDFFMNPGIPAKRTQEDLARQLIEAVDRMTAVYRTL